MAKNRPNENTKRAFGAWLTRKMLEEGMKQGRRLTIEEFAEILGAERARVSNWLNGKFLPDELALYKIASIYGDEVYEITETEPPQLPLNIIVRAILQRLDKVSPELLEQLKQESIDETERRKNRRSNGENTEQRFTTENGY